MKFLIETPVLTIYNAQYPRACCYYLKNTAKNMVCYDILDNYFKINKCRKISLNLSDKPSGESVEFVFIKHKHYHQWLGIDEKPKIWRYFFEDTELWLMKTPPFCNMKDNGEITVHVSVNLKK